MEERILRLVQEESVSWKGLLLALVKEEGMDPWDIKIGRLTHLYIEKIKVLKKANLNLSGKVLLAAAILLRIKSMRLVSDDLSEFDKLLAPPAKEEAFYDDLEQELLQKEVHDEKYELHPRIPQPRKRKVSIYDLVNALEKALEVKQRRLNRIDKVHVEVPDHYDISSAIERLLGRLREWFGRSKKVLFSQIIPSNTKQDKIQTFQPLLHLAHTQQVHLRQKEPFGEIEIFEEEPEEEH